MKSDRPCLVFGGEDHAPLKIGLLFSPTLEANSLTCLISFDEQSIMTVTYISWDQLPQWCEDHHCLLPNLRYVHRYADPERLKQAHEMLAICRPDKASELLCNCWDDYCRTIPTITSDAGYMDKYIDAETAKKAEELMKKGDVDGATKLVLGFTRGLSSLPRPPDLPRKLSLDYENLLRFAWLRDLFYRLSTYLGFNDTYMGADYAFLDESGKILGKVYSGYELSGVAAHDPLSENFYYAHRKRAIIEDDSDYLNWIGHCLGNGPLGGEYQSNLELAAEYGSLAMFADRLWMLTNAPAETSKSMLKAELLPFVARNKKQGTAISVYLERFDDQLKPRFGLKLTIGPLI